MKVLRERLLQVGTQTLSTEDLLTLVLSTGAAREQVRERLTTLLIHSGGLRGIVRADFGQLCQEYGIGPAKTAQLQAVLELARRLNCQVEAKEQITSVADAASMVMADMTHLDHEQIRVLILDTKHCVMANMVLYQGTVNSSVLRAAEIFRPAVTRKATSLILCHNHPSGDPTPSPEDLDVTRQLIAAGKLLDIDLLDHIIIGDQRFVSLKERMR